jgi:uncharacterized membrane protein YtjA (UPF0391 family)
MRSAVLFLLLTISAAIIGLVGVAEPVAGIVQLAFFSLLVVFVFLMVRYLAQDR